MTFDKTYLHSLSKNAKSVVMALMKSNAEFQCSNEGRQQISMEALEYRIELLQKGVTAMGLRVTEGATNLQDLIILNVDTKQEASDLLNRDPAVAAGAQFYELHECVGILGPVSAE